MAENSGDLSLGYMMGQSEGGGSNGGFGGMFGEGLWAIIILAMLGFGRNGFGGGFGGNDGGGGLGFGWGGCRGPWATQEDVRAAVDQQTLVSKLDQQTYGLADSFTALNNTLNSNFRSIDNAICTLGFQSQQGFSGLGAQLAQCCCDIERGIERNTTQGVMNTNAIQQQISACCCDLEKANCNTLQAIDKLGDRIIGFMSEEKMQTLRDENQALRLSASQAHQNNVIRSAIDASTAEIIRRTGNECPVPAYVVPNPNCCYGNPLGVGYAGYGYNGYGNFGNQRSDGCGCGCC